MVKIIIKYANGDKDFPIYFDSRQEADDWLLKEQNKEYWKASNITEIIDSTPTKEATTNFKEAERAYRQGIIEDVAWLNNCDLSQVKDPIVIEIFTRLLRVMGI